MAPNLVYPPPLADVQNIMMNGLSTDVKIRSETPVLIVGGGPVGMILALMLARIHKQKCVVVEREHSTTVFPKMEFTNGRSMEIYRALGLVDDLRKVGTAVVPEHFENIETVVTSLVEGGKLVHVFEHDGAASQRKKSRAVNDGTKYQEPHMRCYQIIIEKWLKEKIDAEPLIESHWSTSFVGLKESEDSVTTELKKANGDIMHIKSQYVIGTDGGGSWVRKAVGLESKREFLDLTFAFAHFRSTALRGMMPFPRAWHSDVLGGGVLVSQNEDDLWTCHYICPPDLDPNTISAEKLIGLAIGGCQGEVKIPVNEIYCRGVWKIDVAVATNFQTQKHARVLLAGDSAHQLSPLGGHGLNSGIGDVFDLAWKLSATLKGWSGENLLKSYDLERRQIALENLQHVQDALAALIMPIMKAPQVYGREVLGSDSSVGEKARAEMVQHCENGKWMLEQVGNILGASYKGSPINIEREEKGARPVGGNALYIPTTFPGSRAPHVWMADGESTLDALSPSHFNVIDFSEDAQLGHSFVEAAKNMKIPLQVIRWDKSKESHVRGIYGRDLLLVRPDHYVAWRSSEDMTEPLSLAEATAYLREATGHAAKEL